MGAKQDKSEEGDHTFPGIPLYADETQRDILDPATTHSSAPWSGANNATFKLLVCVEAMRDLERLLERLLPSFDPKRDRRELKHVALSVFNLANGVHALFRELEGNANAYASYDRPQREAVKRWRAAFEVRVPLGKDSPLKLVRDKIAAHLDVDAVASPEQAWAALDLNQLLSWMCFSLDALCNLLNLNVYAWWLDDGTPGVRKLMSVDGTVVSFVGEGKDMYIGAVTLAASPKTAVDDQIVRLVKLNNDHHDRQGSARGTLSVGERHGDCAK